MSGSVLQPWPRFYKSSSWRLQLLTCNAVNAKTRNVLQTGGVIFFLSLWLLLHLQIEITHFELWHQWHWKPPKWIQYNIIFSPSFFKLKKKFFYIVDFVIKLQSWPKKKGQIFYLFSTVFPHLHMLLNIIINTQVIVFSSWIKFSIKL